MKCFNCNANISNIDKYCPRCGMLFANNDVERIADNLENQLLNYYLNKNSNYLFNISLGYLFFNFAYAFYKKMYTQGIISATMLYLLLRFVSSGFNMIYNSMGFYFLLVIFIILGSLVVNVYYLFHFNDLYINNSKCRVHRIINLNKNKDIETLNKICEKDSKGNLVLALISILIFFALYL